MSLSRVAALALAVSGLAGPGVAAQVTYQDLKPLFQNRCVVCHSGPGAPLGLSLDSYQGLMEGSSRGPVVKPGEPGGSELLRRLRGDSQPRMPLTGPPWVPQEDIARVAADILTGPFNGTRVLPLHGPKDYSFSEVADMIGQAIGKNVAHVKVDPKQTRQALTDMGLSEHMAAMMVELHEAIDEGRLKGEHPRTEQTTTPTKFEEFARRTIKPAVQE